MGHLFTIRSRTHRLEILSNLLGLLLTESPEAYISSRYCLLAVLSVGCRGFLRPFTFYRGGGSIRCIRSYLAIYVFVVFFPFPTDCIIFYRLFFHDFYRTISLRIADTLTKGNLHHWKQRIFYIVEHKIDTIFRSTIIN